MQPKQPLLVESVTWLTTLEKVQGDDRQRWAEVPTAVQPGVLMPLIYLMSALMRSVWTAGQVRLLAADPVPMPVPAKDDVAALLDRPGRRIVRVATDLLYEGGDRRITMEVEYRADDAL